MAFINEKSDKKSDSKDRFKKRDDDESSSKKKFDNKPPTSDEDDDEDRGKSRFKNKFKKGGDDDERDDKGRDRFDKDEDKDKDRFGKKKKSDDQDVTKDFDRDGDDTEKTDVDKKRGDEVEGNEDEKGKGKKEKGGCNCGRQIEVNPPLRTQYEAIAALPPSLQADAVAALAEQETEKILSSLAEKADEHGVAYDILFEVFKRGWFSGRGSDHLSEAEIGFNRVNSFLAGGLARRLDEDLIMEAKKDQGVWQSGKTEYYTKAGKNKDSAQSRIDRSWSARGEDGKSFHGFGTKRQALQTKQQYDAWCKRGKTGYMNDPIKEDMGINTPADDMVCDRDEPTPGEKLKSKLRRKKK